MASTFAGVSFEALEISDMRRCGAILRRNARMGAKSGCISGSPRPQFRFSELTNFSQSSCSNSRMPVLRPITRSGI